MRKEVWGVIARSVEKNMRTLLRLAGRVYYVAARASAWRGNRRRFALNEQIAASFFDKASQMPCAVYKERPLRPSDSRAPKSEGLVYQKENGHRVLLDCRWLNSFSTLFIN